MAVRFKRVLWPEVRWRLQTSSQPGRRQCVGSKQPLSASVAPR